MEIAWKWIFAFILLLLIYGVLTSNIKQYALKENNYFNRDTELYTKKEFCSSNNAKEQFRNVEDCCSSRLSCGNGKRGHWDSKKSECLC